MNFQTFNVEYDKLPIVLIDNSGSTSVHGKWGSVKSSILKYEKVLTSEILKDRNISECYLMFWNNTPKIIGKISVEELRNYKQRDEGCTNLETALKAIPNDWFTEGTDRDIYIITDGEINGGNCKPKLRELINKGFNIRIFTVESNDTNYLVGNCSAGNAIYKAITQESLAKNVKEFVSFNGFYHTGFVSLLNLAKKVGYYSYHDKYFPVDKVADFIQYVQGEVDNWKHTKDSYDNEISELKLKLRSLKLPKDEESSQIIHNEEEESYSWEVVDNEETSQEEKPKGQSLEQVLDDFDARVAEADLVADKISKLTEKLSVHDADLMALVHKFNYTISQITDGKSYAFKKGFTDTISRMFDETTIYKDVRKIMLKESEKICAGKGSTFQEYRKNRDLLFQRSQQNLYDNVKESIHANTTDFSLSFPFKNTIYVVDNERVNETVKLAMDVYNNAGFRVGNYVYPILPYDPIMSNDDIEQCLRQWIRINYSKVHNMNVAADLIMYLFLTDVLNIYLSDADENIKKSYVKLAKIMINRKRFGTKVKEMIYLMDNNPPAPVVGDPEEIVNIFNKCLANLGITDGSVAPMTLWYGIVKMFNNNSLDIAQKQFCQQDMAKNGINETNIMSFLKSKFPKVNVYKDSQEIVELRKLNYNCFITGEDTANTGGYMIPAYDVTSSIRCSPNCVISPNITTDTIKCPYFGRVFKVSELKKVEPRHIAEQRLAETGHGIPYIDIPNYNLDNFKIIEITDDMHKTNDVTMKRMDECNFEAYNYEINAPVIDDSISNRFMEVKTQEEFNNAVAEKYPYLTKLNMTNMCLAGGFCRSILLRQRLKDLDFFFYGDMTDEQYLNRFAEALNELLNLLHEYYEKDVKFLIMYKPMFNVFEVVCVRDPTNFIKEDYNLDNFKQYDFKSLHKYDKYTVIDPETGKIYKRQRYGRMAKFDDKEEFNERMGFSDENNRDFAEKVIENKDFSNYFEDGDITGIKMLLRVQFILTKNNTIEKIFNDFDMNPCRVAYDGKITHFTNGSEMAYRYMINIINESNYSEMFDHRVSKYFIYGFSVILPELDITKVRLNRDLNIAGLSFRVSHKNGNMITVEKDSQIRKQLESLNKIERRNKEQGKALYKSKLFCSLISLLRYVKINNINYLFTDKITCPSSDGNMEFRESETKVHFIDSIDSRVPGFDIYKDNRKEPKEETINVPDGVKYTYTQVDRKESDDEDDSQSVGARIYNAFQRGVNGARKVPVKRDYSSDEESSDDDY